MMVAASRVVLERDGFKVEVEVGPAMEDDDSNEVIVGVVASEKSVLLRLGERKEGDDSIASCEVATWKEGKVELYGDDEPFYVSPEMLVTISTSSKLNVPTVKRALVAYAKACEFDMTFTQPKR